MKIEPEAQRRVADLLCQHHDKLPAGTDLTELRQAMREFAHTGHLGCRQRLDSMSCIGELTPDTVKQHCPDCGDVEVVPDLFDRTVPVSALCPICDNRLYFG